MIKPFTPTVWLLLIFNFILVATLAQILRHFRLRHELPITSMHHSRRSLETLFRLLLEQCANIPKEIRLLTASWLLFLIVLNSGYKKGFFSSLTFPEMEDQPREILQFPSYPDYRLLFQYWPSHMYNQWKSTSEFSVMNGIFRRLEPQKDFTNCVIQAVTERGVVCIGYDFNIAVILAKNLTFRGGFLQGSHARLSSIPHLL